MKRLLYLCLLTVALLIGCASESTINKLQDDTYEDGSITQSTVFEPNHTNKSETAIATTYPTLAETTNVTIETTETVSERICDDGQLVRILDYIPDADIDLRYATTNNFTGIVIYDDPEAYLCYGTVKKLMEVQRELKEIGYRILIWDAYRSPEAQWKLWEAYPDPTYVANPNNGITSHSRGNTIDISIVHEDGTSVEMPSAFDEFAAIADRDYSDVSETAATNSRLLEDIMLRNGFTGYHGEWWDYSDTNRYEVKPVIHDKIETYDPYLSEILNLNNLNYTDIVDSSQLIIVDSDDSVCEVYLYEMDEMIWKQILKTEGFIGKNGTSSNKVEGDYCTPSGLYTLGFGFGTEVIDTNIEYRLINDDCYWVDDSGSKYYNQWIETKDITWNSAEHLIDHPQSYHYGIVINYNMNPVTSGKGSAIFLHCSTGSYTAGCVAVPDDKMCQIIKWVDCDKNPLILIN